MVDSGNKIIRLINVASGTFAQGENSQSVSNACLHAVLLFFFSFFDSAHLHMYQGAGVVGNPSAALFKIAPRNNLGEFA